MLYTVLIPAKFAADFAAGSVALMTTSAGATTALVSGTGTIVGTAALVEASGVAAGAGAATGGSGGAAAAAAGGMALGPILVIGIGALALVGLGVYLWRRNRKQPADVEMVEFTVECDAADADAVLAEVHSIVEAAAARLAAENVA